MDRTRMTRAIAAAVGLLVLGGCGVPVAPEASLHTQPARLATGAVDGVVFLAPVTDLAAPDEPGASGIVVSVQAFAFAEPTEAAPSGGPVGASYSTTGGTISVQRGVHSVTWTARDAGVAAGTRLRFEVRTGNAPAGVPSCTAGPDVDGAGCLGFFDAWVGRPNDPRLAGIDVQALVAERAPLRIRFFVRDGAANVAPVVTLGPTAPGTTLASFETFLASATAFDLEDGDLTSSIVWSLEPSGAQVGTGGDVSVMLGAGVRALTATVTDSGGRSASASIGAFVLETFQVDPLGTYLPKHQADPAGAPTTVDLATLGAAAGDVLVLRSYGAFKAGDAFEDDIGGLFAVFAGDDGYLATVRGLQAVPPTCGGEGGDFTNDIPEDFDVLNYRFNFVDVPDGATRIEFSTPDCFFGDNTDPNGDYRVGIGVMRFVAVEPRGTHLATHAADGALSPTSVPLSSLGIGPLDLVALAGIGAYSNGDGAADDSSTTLAVFEGNDGFLPAPGTTSPPTTVCFDGDWSSNDVPEDFELEAEVIQVLLVPPEADRILFGPHDCFFQDNTDPNADYGVVIGR